MAKQDYYATLGAAKGASADDLKKAYRKLAMQYHPDRNPGDAAAEARFKEINEAYDILKDDQKRAAYDRYGHAAFENGGPQPGGFDFGGGGGLGDIFDQVFGDFMGGQRGQRGGGQRGGRDLRAAVEIDLEEAFAGVKVPLRVATRVACEACSGTGAEGRDRATDTCTTCNGAGKVRAQNGFFLVERPCPTCGGAGRTIRNPCKICRGSATVQREKSITVPVPAGVEDGVRIRMAGEGEAGGPGQQPGDLYVHVAIRAHPIFQRDGAHVFCRVPLRMTQAALGADVEVPVIDGSRTRMKVPPGTGTGDQFRLRGKGFSVMGNTQRGDMIIQVAVETPQHLTKRQRELLEEFDAESKDPARSNPESEGFFTKMRDFFDAGKRGNAKRS